MAYKRIGAAVRYAGTRGISLCFIAAIKETLSRLCQGEQLDGKGKNDLVVSVPFRNPFEHAHPCYNPPTRRRYRVDDTIRRYILVHNVYFSSSSFFFFLASILSLSVESIVGKFLRLFLLITINVTIVEPSLRITHRSLHIFLFSKNTLLRCEKNFVVNENTLEQYTIILGTSRDVARDRIYISSRSNDYIA